MTWLLLGLPIGIIAAILIYLGLQSGEIAVRRSLLMHVDRQTAFDRVRDLKGWPDWSPWLLHEPNARVELSEQSDQESGWYAWDGKLIGAGRITHVRFDAPERIEQRIAFERPFKATGAVSWEFAERDGGTEVFWLMRGRMPFMLRFLAPTMSRLLAKDYDLGLALLRARLDPDADQLAIRFVGDVERPAQGALTIPFDGDLKAMVAAMRQGFPRLAAAAAERGIEPAGPLFTAYHKADPKSGHFRCDLALPVPDGTAAGELELKLLGGGRYYLAEVQGSYDFLEPAWYSVMAHVRMIKAKWDRGRPSLEVYAVDPETAASANDILTQIYVPVR